MDKWEMTLQSTLEAVTGPGCSRDWCLVGADALTKDIQDHVKNTTAPYKYPGVVEYVDQLPKTISGKMRRVELREEDNV